MTHVDEGRLQAYLDGELVGDERDAVDRHIAVCAVCAAALDALRSTAARLTAALRLLDVPAREDAVDRAIARRNAARHARFVRRDLRRGLLRAAVLVLAFAAVGTAALPGSPVRAWLDGVWTWASVLVEDDAPPPAPVQEVAAAEPADPAPDPEPSGISILPSAGRVRILVEGAAPEARLRVRLVAGDRVAVRTSGAAADARFRTGQDRIEIVGAGAGELSVELPYSLRSATVEVGGRVYVVKSGAELRSMVGAGGAGTELVFPLDESEANR